MIKEIIIFTLYCLFGTYCMYSLVMHEIRINKAEKKIREILHKNVSSFYPNEFIKEKITPYELTKKLRK